MNKSNLHQGLDKHNLVCQQIEEQKYQHLVEEMMQKHKRVIEEMMQKHERDMEEMKQKYQRDMEQMIRIQNEHQRELDVSRDMVLQHEEILHYY
jgi:hypothetical protein